MKKYIIVITTKTIELVKASIEFMEGIGLTPEVFTESTNSEIIEEDEPEAEPEPIRTLLTEAIIADLANRSDRSLRRFYSMLDEEETLEDIIENDEWPVQVQDAAREILAGMYNGNHPLLEQSEVDDLPESEESDEGDTDGETPITQGHLEFVSKYSGESVESLKALQRQWNITTIEQALQMDLPSHIRNAINEMLKQA